MKALIFLSKGYEEVEALTVVDYLRRAGLEIDMVATEGELETTGAHGIQIKAEKLLSEVKAADYDMMITPGGMEGTHALAENNQVIKLLQEQFAKKDGYIASICASPIVLARAGIAQKIKGTVYPGLEDQVNFQEYDSESLVVNDKEHRVITSQGPATAVYFALEIIGTIRGDQARTQVAEGLLLPKVEAKLK